MIQTAPTMKMKKQKQQREKVNAYRRKPLKLTLMYIQIKNILAPWNKYKIIFFLSLRKKELFDI